MGNPLRIAVFALVLAAFGCGPSGDDAEKQSALQGEDDEGTELSATAAHARTTCARTGTTGSASFDLSVSTTGSVDSAEVWLSVDGQPPRKVALVEPQDFVHDGRNKTASFTLSTTLTSGAHEVEFCFIESGAHGREPKQTCADKVPVQVSCGADAGSTPGPNPTDAGQTPSDAGSTPQPEPAPTDAGTTTPTCPTPAFFGELTDRTSLCGPSDPSSIAIRAEGDFGPSATVRIEAPNGCVLEGLMRRPDTCTAAFNWAAATEHSGPGNYTFTVRGNGRSVSITRYLSCPR